MRLVAIAAGPFTMGSDPRAAYPPDPDEAPARRAPVASFLISRAPVTNGEYRAFVEATGREAPAHWPAADDLPVTYVDRADAEAYCAWAGGRLPTEVEWERAARGGDDRWWPWGDRPPEAPHANFGGTPGAPSPVGSFPDGASPFGVLDLAGNVWEWTADGGVRGGSYIHGPGDLRCSARQPLRAGVVDAYVGFRIAAGADVGALAPLLGWAAIPAGEVVLGNDPVEPGGPALPDETPPHEVDLAAFSIGRTPVTNGEYAPFAAERGRPAPSGPPDHPVTYVSWHDAVAFCAWAGARLPTEAEWERAAGGPDGRLYPWGDEEPDESRAVFGRGTREDATASVEARPAGASAEGVLDLAGNVWEWTASAHRPYPYRAGDGREDPASREARVLRGGSFASPGPLWLRCANRSHSYSTRSRGHIGFRVAQDGGTA